MEKTAFHGFVSGRVQGVWFRYSTQKKAEDLGLTGWVRNLPDGRVEVMACGQSANVKTFASWLWVGPSRAKVTDVTGDECEYEEHQGFIVI